QPSRQASRKTIAATSSSNLFQLPVDQEHAEDADSHAEKRHRREPFVEQRPSHQRRHRRRQIEQAYDPRRRDATDQEGKQPDSAARQDQNEPAKREQKLRRPVHDAGFEDSRPERKQKSRRRILYAERRPPIDLATKALLIEGADRDAEERNRARQPCERRRAAGGRPIAHDQINAEQPKREPNPLQQPNALAEPAIDNRRGQRRLQAEDQRDHSSRQPVLDRDEHAAETKAVHHQAGDRAVRHTARARPFGPREREYATSNTTTMPMRSARNVSG